MKQNSSMIPVTMENYHIGMQVVRGRDWDWKDQDENSVYGTIIYGEDTSLRNKWVRVRWITYENTYRIGDDDCFDLYQYEDPFVKAVREINEQRKQDQSR